MATKQHTRKRTATRRAEPPSGPASAVNDNSTDEDDSTDDEDDVCQKPGRAARAFGEIANRGSQAAGRASTFIIAVGLIVTWAVTGPIFGFSDTWQLIINTSTTIVTFLMVFLIQNSQNRDSAAIQVKLDELIRVGAARNSLVGIEHMTDEELEELREKCEQRANSSKSRGKQTSGGAPDLGDAAIERVHKKARHAADKIQG